MAPARTGGRRDAPWHETKKVKKEKQKAVMPNTILPHTLEPEVVPKGKAAKKREEG